MNKLLYIAILLLGLSSCSDYEMKISGRFIGTDGDMVYLEKNSTLEQVIVDSVKLDDNGNFQLALKEVPHTPSLYHIIHDGNKIPLLIQSGDNIEVEAAGNIAFTYKVTGSTESELLKEFNAEYLAGAKQINDIVAQYQEGMSQDEIAQLNKQLNAAYIATKQMQLRFINEHKGNIAAVYALYQRLPGDQHLFKGDSDIIYYKTVAEAIGKNYPNSPYLSILNSQIARMDAQLSLESMITETNLPELELPDMYGNKVAISSLEGKVFLIQFWSAELGNSNAFNADLKELYAKYHDKGFEVYQIAIDTSRALWIDAVQQQALPWISVCDLMGMQSPSLILYNVQGLPYSLLIDAEGNIVSKPTSVEQIEQELQALM